MTTNNTDSAQTDPDSQSQCPKCHDCQSDLDGFGVIHCETCGYCQHPHREFIAGAMQCGICGHRDPQEPR